MRNFVLTSESFTEGHPDKLCDQISDAVIDASLSTAPGAGCVAECAIATGVVFLSIRHGAPLGFDPAVLARGVMSECGYPDSSRAGQTTVILDTVETPEIAGPFDRGPLRATRMTTAFGHACRQTEARMPWPVDAAHRIAARLDAARAEDEDLAWLSPDAQVQVAVRFEARRPVALDAVALTLCAEAAAPEGEALGEEMRARILEPLFAGGTPALDERTRLVARRAGGPCGPSAHSGLTGRKGSDDGYGGFVRQGSSALSGKDPSRIDRTAAYAARQAAVSLVAAGLAEDVEVQLSWVAGDEGPASVEVDSFGTGERPDEALSDLLCGAMDFRIAAILERLDLWGLPEARGGRFYRELARYGHFGRADLDLPWDRPVELGRDV
jgi:S-adenosylmethionine synthetase